MNESDETKDFERLVPDHPSPGEMLKNAREALSLSHIDVAKHLKLRTQWIVDIENDQYEDAAALIYVRGYLKSYARFVNVSTEKVMDAFNNMKFDELFDKPKPVSSSEEQFVKNQSVLSYEHTRKKGRSKKITLGITAIIVLLLVVIAVLMWLRAEKVISLSHQLTPQMTISTSNTELNAQTTMMR
jgi:cytoskeleton protein RodZ